MCPSLISALEVLRRCAI